MTDTVTLACPLCGASVADGEAPAPGRCPGCGARFMGDADAAPEAVAAALADLGAPELPVTALTQAIFGLSAEDEVARGVAITSDRRDGFYRWWLFLRADPGEETAALAALLPPPS